MAGYTRNDTPNNIADGNVINASDLDGEFDAVQAAFNGSTGHSHDGSSGNGPQIAAGGIASNAVTTAKILDANVTLAKMAANSVDSDQYVDGSIDTAHIGNLQVTTAKIAADAIDGTKIADDSIDSEHYVAGSIDAEHLASNSVTSAKLDTNIQVAGTLGVTGETTLSTHLNMGDNDIIKLGADADLQIYHDADGSQAGQIGSYIQDAGTGNLYIRGTSLVLEDNSGNDFIAMNDTGTGGTVTLKHNAVAKLATTSTGVTVTGELLADTVDATTLQIGNTSITATAAELNYNDITALGQVEALKTVTADSNGWVNFGDNERLRFGASNDLAIYHNGSYSIIQDNGTGNLILAAQDFSVTNPAVGENMITAAVDGAVTLYYDNANKLATNSGGVTVTGTVTSDGLVMGDNEEIQLGDSTDLRIYHDGSNSIIRDAGTGNLQIQADDFKVMNAAGTENILFAAEDGVVRLFYNNSTKFETTSTGVTVTGRSVGGTPTPENDGSFDLSANNDFTCTTTTATLITFTNAAAGQSGNIKFVNGGNHTITADTMVAINADVLSTLSVSGTYHLAYYVTAASGADTILVSASAALT